MSHFNRTESAYPSLWKGCVGAWCPSLGPGGTCLSDQSGFRRHGTLTNMDPATDWIISGGKHALDFDGTNDVVRIPDVDYPVATMSAFCWVWKSAASSNQLAFSHYETSTTQRTWSVGTANTTWTTGGTPDGNELGVIVSTDGTLSAGQHRAVWVNQSICDSAWHHVGFTWRAGTLKLWIDGKEGTVIVHNDSAMTTLNAGTSSLSIGAINSDSTPASLWNGYVDDARLYNRALDAQEVRLLARRRGIAYETRRHRSVKAAAAGGNRRRRVLLMGSQ